MKLVALDESKLECLIAVLGPVAEKLVTEGNTFEAAKVIDLRLYIRSRIESAPEVKTASEMGKKGGCSKSKKKLAAAKVNAKKGGGVGRYYARLVIETGTTDVPPQVIHYFFADKQKRDEWLKGPGVRYAVSSVDRDLRVLQQKDPESLAAGDARLQSELERQRLFDRYERCHDVMEDCDGCGDLVERKFRHVVNSNTLCPVCMSAVRFLRHV
ncbi:MAG: hypothetical protein SFY67_05845 [Candidatus Melainabacteria bacterium]|nr:hypothetical protein [Candidatus Melainabacteria bacterium]